MIYKIFPTQDTTIYSQYPDMNTGRDEIIEINNYASGEGFLYPNTSRILIQFSQEEITNMISVINTQANRIEVTSAITASWEYSFINGDFPIDGDSINFLIGGDSVAQYFFSDSPSSSNQIQAYTGSGNEISWFQNYYNIITSSGSFFYNNFTNSLDSSSFTIYSNYNSYFTSSNIISPSGFNLNTANSAGIPPTYEYDFDVILKLYAANIEGLSSESVIKAYPISGAWSMGTGKYLDNDYEKNGASWIWRDYSGSIRWITSSFEANSTGSFNQNSPGGATWYTNYSTSQSFGYYSEYDIELPVKNIINHWAALSMSNNGFIIKLDEEFIDNINYQPLLKYFSRDSHTIYPPYLEFRWDDYSFNTGSSNITFISSSELKISINNKNNYISGSINKFRLYTSPKYPARVFQTSSLYSKNYYLPTNSYYAIKDSYTNEYICNFSKYTKISADEISNYFIVSMSGLEPERYYKFLIKTEIDGNIYIIDDNYNFKVLNG